MRPLRRRTRLAVLLTLATAWGCGSGDLVLPPGGETARIVTVEGDAQTGPVGAELPGPLIVQLVDDAGNGIANRAIVWIVSAGGGSVDPGSRTTDPQGFAVAQWTLGPAPGANEVQVQVPGVGSVTFTATATGGGGGPGPVATTIEAVEGDGQSAPAGSKVPVRPAVRVTDAQGAPVKGVTVTFAVTGGGGSVDDPVRTTGDDGIARSGNWTLGPAAGSNTLEARAGSLEGSPVVFTATGTSEPSPQVARLVYQAAPHDVRKGESFRVAVALVDRNGDVVPLSGIVIFVGLFPQGSHVPNNQQLKGERFVASVNGVSTFDLSIGKKGTYRLRALTDDLPELGPHGPEPFLFSDPFDVK